MDAPMPAGALAHHHTVLTEASAAHTLALSSAPGPCVQRRWPAPGPGVREGRTEASPGVQRQAIQSPSLGSSTLGSSLGKCF